MFDDFSTAVNSDVRSAMDRLLTAPIAKLLRNRRFCTHALYGTFAFPITTQHVMYIKKFNRLYLF